MEIEKVELIGFRNFSRSTINFNANTLILGANDVGKTNLIFALRLLLDRSLSERDIEPQTTDFYIDSNGQQVSDFEVNLFFKNVCEDSARSILRGHVSEDDTSVFSFRAKLSGDYQILTGSSMDDLQEANSRFYLKAINLKYVQSRRDLKRFIESEKKHLLKIAKEERPEQEVKNDDTHTSLISKSLTTINSQIKNLNYVRQSTSLVNEELKSLSHLDSGYRVTLDTGAIQVQQFIDNLQLGAEKNGAPLLLGGDGRDNQILLALWKAKSEREHDPQHHVTFYCVEEPEAHLHPHQQRRLASYLNESLCGQVLITTHSPQVVEQFKPSSIIRLYIDKDTSVAASEGCSQCINDAWDDLGYRMSILPAEAFFSSCVLLVEGPSEKLLYQEMSKEFDKCLDYFNVSIISVDGVQFKVYTQILSAMGIPYVVRTDNDVSKVPHRDERTLAGFNRCIEIANMTIPIPPIARVGLDETPESIASSDVWKDYSKLLNPRGLFVARVDLETDLYDELALEMEEFSGSNDKLKAINYLKSSKAINMRQFISRYRSSLAKIENGELAKPLLQAIERAKGL